MDIKLYIEARGQQREALEGTIELQTDLHEVYGVKQVTEGGVKVLSRVEVNGGEYEIHLKEPHGGATLQRLMDAGKRVDLWVVYGETTRAGRKDVFKPVETYVVKNLLPFRRVMGRDNQVSSFFVTLDRPARQMAD